MGFKLNLVFAAALVAGLTACGGGGSSDPAMPGPESGSGGVTPPVPPAPTEPPESIHTPGSTEEAYANLEQTGFTNTLNNYRTQCGIPALMRNTILDNASNVKGSGTVIFGQAMALPGDNVATARTAGYAMPDSVGNVYSAFVTQMSVNQPTDPDERTAAGKYVAQVAMIEPYGLLTMMRPYTEIGTDYSFQLYTVRAIKSVFGNLQPLRTVPGSVVTFPCANTVAAIPAYSLYGSSGASYISTLPGSTSVPYSTRGPYFGNPIAVYANANEALVLTTATVTAQGGGGVSVELRDATKIAANLMHQNEGLVVPTGTLLPSTAYDVMINGTINGAAFSKVFTFRTGSAIPTNPI